MFDLETFVSLRIWKKTFEIDDFQVSSNLGGSSLLSTDICNDDTECLIQSENRFTLIHHSKHENQFNKPELFDFISKQTIWFHFKKYIFETLWCQQFVNLVCLSKMMRCHVQISLKIGETLTIFVY